MKLQRLKRLERSDVKWVFFFGGHLIRQIPDFSQVGFTIHAASLRYIALVRFGKAMHRNIEIYFSKHISRDKQFIKLMII